MDGPKIVFSFLQLQLVRLVLIVVCLLVATPNVLSQTILWNNNPTQVYDNPVTLLNAASNNQNYFGSTLDQLLHQEDHRVGANFRNAPHAHVNSPTTFAQSHFSPPISYNYGQIMSSPLFEQQTFSSPLFPQQIMSSPMFEQQIMSTPLFHQQIYQPYTSTYSSNLPVVTYNHPYFL